jgi:hypothetical protein
MDNPAPGFVLLATPELRTEEHMGACIDGRLSVPDAKVRPLLVVVGCDYFLFGDRQ